MMTSRERMLAAYKKQKTDRLPVSPEIWSATVLEYKKKPFHHYFGPFADEDYTAAWLETQVHFGFDAWLLSGLAKPKEGSAYEEKSSSRFVAPNMIETSTEIRTKSGAISWISRTNGDYDGWGFENPVKDFNRDIGPYVEYTLDDPSLYDDAMIRRDLEIVGDKGLLSAHIGDLFISYLANGRAGGLTETLYDLEDHEDEIKEIHQKYIHYMTAKIARLTSIEGLESVCVTNGYSNAGVLGPNLYMKWEIPLLEAIAEKAHHDGLAVHLHQHGRSRQVLEKIAETGIDLVDCLERPSANGDVDDLEVIALKIGKQISLKGNIDPINVLKNGTEAMIWQQARECIRASGFCHGYILSTGDSVVEGTPFRNLELLREIADAYQERQ